MEDQFWLSHNAKHCRNDTDRNLIAFDIQGSHLQCGYGKASNVRQVTLISAGVLANGKFSQLHSYS